jgi:hypothetical protein
MLETVVAFAAMLAAMSLMALAINLVLAVVAMPLAAFAERRFLATEDIRRFRTYRRVIAGNHLTIRVVAVVASALLCKAAIQNGLSPIGTWMAFGLCVFGQLRHLFDCAMRFVLGDRFPIAFRRENLPPALSYFEGIPGRGRD